MTITLFQTIIFALIQGITELFPISSVAHGVLTPYVFHWHFDQTFLQEHFLPYMVMLHLGTAVALLVYFRRDWIRLLGSLADAKQKESRQLLFLVIVGCVPTGIIGLVLEKPLRHIFSNVYSAAIFLIVNGFILYYGDNIRRGRKNIGDLSVSEATLIGIFQSLALIPGFSRSGVTMTAGFRAGLTREASARFAMLLATPIIGGASLLEIPKLFKAGGNGLLEKALIGGIVAGVFAYLSVAFLMRWFKTHEVSAMRPFAYYCWIVGVVVLLTQFL